MQAISLNVRRRALIAPLLTIVVLVAAFGLSLAGERTTAAAGTWAPTGGMAVARYQHTASLLPSGKVLIAGGGYYGGSGTNTRPEPLASSELYDPVTTNWIVTGSMTTPRSWHTSTVLPNGDVLAAGGHMGISGVPLASAEVYNTVSGTWAATGSMANPRYDFSATLLPNGKVLVVGGITTLDVGQGSASAELFDPASGLWSTTSSLAAARYGHTATLLPNGKVLVAGGYHSGVFLASAELFDPISNTWSATGNLTTGRVYHTATLLPNGKVLVAGGYNLTNPSLESAELYDPAAGSWTPSGDMSLGRLYHSASLLANGSVLVAGGDVSPSGCCPIGSAELYDSATGVWSTTGGMITVREWHTTTLLPDGTVLAAGGYSQAATAMMSAELYGPTAPAPTTPAPTTPAPVTPTPVTPTPPSGPGGTPVAVGGKVGLLTAPPRDTSDHAVGGDERSAVLLATGGVVTAASAAWYTGRRRQR